MPVATITAGTEVYTSAGIHYTEGILLVAVAATASEAHDQTHAETGHTVTVVATAEFLAQTEGTYPGLRLALRARGLAVRAAVGGGVIEQGNQIVAADDASVVQLVHGDPVVSWPDESGLGNDATQPSTEQAPIFRELDINGLPSVAFNGSDTFLHLLEADLLGATAAVEGITVVAVVVSDNPPDVFHRHLLALSTGASGTDIRFALDQRADPGQAAVFGRRLDADADAEVAGSSLVLGRWEVLVGVADYQAGTASVYRNGALNVTGAFQAAGVTSNTPSLTAKVGVGPDGSQHFWNGRLADLYLWPRVLSAAERDELTATLMAEYALSAFTVDNLEVTAQATVSGTHAYRTADPATVTVQATVSAVETPVQAEPARTVTAQATVSETERQAGVEAGTVLALATITGPDAAVEADEATEVTAAATISGTDTTATADQTTVTALATVSEVAGQTQVEARTVTTQATVSGTDESLPAGAPLQVSAQATITAAALAWLAENLTVSVQATITSGDTVGGANGSVSIGARAAGGLLFGDRPAGDMLIGAR